MGVCHGARDRAAQPAAPARGAVATEKLALGASELYWLPSGGYQDAQLDRKALDDLVGPSAVRTKDTVEALATKSFTS